MFKKERKLVKQGNSTVIVLDKTLREISGFEVGNTLMFDVQKGKIIITKIKEQKPC